MTPNDEVRMPGDLKSEIGYLEAQLEHVIQHPVTHAAEIVALLHQLVRLWNQEENQK